jgi:hypothetical protein
MNSFLKLLAFLTAVKIYHIQDFLLLSEHFMWLYFSVFIVTMFIPVPRIISWNLKGKKDVNFIREVPYVYISKKL